MPWMIAHKMDLWRLHEIVIASAEPNPIPPLIVVEVSLIDAAIIPKAHSRITP